MIKNLKELDSDGWAIDKEKNGISVKYKFQKGCPSVSFKIQIKALGFYTNGINNTR